MKFTLVMIGVPILLVAATMDIPSLKFITKIGANWFWVSIPLVLLYWLTRVVRRAWRDGAARGEA